MPDTRTPGSRSSTVGSQIRPLLLAGLALIAAMLAVWLLEEVTGAALPLMLKAAVALVGNVGLAAICLLILVRIMRSRSAKP